jgi:hypothetical protein
MESMPLLLNDEGLRWMSYDEWEQVVNGAKPR